MNKRSVFLDNIAKEIAKRQVKEVMAKISDNIDLSTIPIDVLRRVYQRYGDDEQRAKDALKAWRKPKNKLCQCTSSAYLHGDWGGIDCWLCGGYSY